MNTSSVLEQEARVVQNLLAATEKASNLAELLSEHTSNTDEVRSMVHDLASQSLALKRSVRSLSRFDAVVKGSQRKSLNRNLPEGLRRRFNQELEDANRNEHHALRELHAISVVLHDISKGPIDPSEITAAMHRLYAEFSRLRLVLKKIRDDISAEATLLRD